MCLPSSPCTVLGELQGKARAIQGGVQTGKHTSTPVQPDVQRNVLAQGRAPRAPHSTGGDSCRIVMAVLVAAVIQRRAAAMASILIQLAVAMQVYSPPDWIILLR